MDNFIKIITNNLPQALVIIGAVFLIMVVASAGNDSKRRRINYRSNSNYRRRANYRNNSNYNRDTHLISFNDQTITEATALSIVSKANYSKRPLMNRSEYALFCKLEDRLEKQHKKERFRLFSQVAMGEFIKSESDDAFRLINGKRVDFVIVDSTGAAVIVIEYQGAGHYQENAIERDAIKREACRKAGIEFLEFKKNYDDLEFERVSRILNANSSQDKQMTSVPNLGKVSSIQSAL